MLCISTIKISFITGSNELITSGKYISKIIFYFLQSNCVKLDSKMYLLLVQRFKILYFLMSPQDPQAMIPMGLTFAFHGWCVIHSLQWRHNGHERHLKPPASQLFTQLFVRAQIKESIKAPRHWPLCGEFTGDRWIPRTNGQQRGKCFHLITSSCTNIKMNPRRQVVSNWWVPIDV